jgi:NADH:ubiquinone oxidoreductase subunit K
VTGILQQNQNFLTLLLKVEVMYIGISLYFFGYGYFLLCSAGLAQGLLVLTFAAAESAFGLSLFFYYYLTQQGKALEPVFRYNKRPKYNINA